MSSSGAATEAKAPAEPVMGAGPRVGKSGKRICCSCPDTKKVRDECVVRNGEDHCAALIEAHKRCLRLEGFHV